MEIDENLENTRRGYLPADGVVQMIAAPGFKASFKKGDIVETSPLVAWAFLSDGTLLPVLYDKTTRSHIVAYAIAGFIEVVHDDYIEDEYIEEEGDTYED